MLHHINTPSWMSIMFNSVAIEVGKPKQVRQAISDNYVIYPKLRDVGIWATLGITHRTFYFHPEVVQFANEILQHFDAQPCAPPNIDGLFPVLI